MELFRKQNVEEPGELSIRFLQHDIFPIFYSREATSQVAMLSALRILQIFYKHSVLYLRSEISI